MYGFSCEGLFNLKTPISIDLEAITFNDEILFSLTLLYDLKNIIFMNFVDFNNISINNALYSNEKVYNNIFILSREKRNVKNLIASYRYRFLTKKITPLFKELLHNLLQYIKNIGDLEENVKNTESTDIYKKVSDAKNDMILITTTVLENLASLRIPIVNKIKKLFTIERFEDALNEIFESLEEFAEIFLKIKNKESGNEKILEKKDVIDYINDVIMRNNSFLKCVEIYKKIIFDLKMIESYTDDFLGFGSVNLDLEIISDCEVERMDEFVKKYSFLLLGYCRIMRKCDFRIVFNYHCYAQTSSEIDSLIMKLEDFYIDKLFAQRFCSFIEDYEEDKTDLLIFSQTEYFENILSLRVLNNLKLAKNIYLNHNITEETQETSDDEMPIENTFYDYIINLEDCWDHILKDNQLNRIKSFLDLI